MSAFDGRSELTLDTQSLRKLEENISAKCNLAVLYSTQASFFNGGVWPSGNKNSTQKIASTQPIRMSLIKPLRNAPHKRAAVTRAAHKGAKRGKLSRAQLLGGLKEASNIIIMFILI